MSKNEEIEPMRIWREWFVKSEKMWSDRLTEMMGDDRYAKGLGRYMQEALHTHRMFSESMAQYLANLNMPSRQDVLELRDRLAHIEDTLAAIQVELREQRSRLASVGNVVRSAGSEDTPVRPARTRRPPQKS